jgi:hypothetical protein
MRHDPGLAASPPVRYKLEMERSGYSPFRLFGCGTDNLLAKRQRAARALSEARQRLHDTEHAGDDTTSVGEPDEGGGQDEDDQRAATAVDRGVDLRAQPAARPAESVIARFVPAAARILVIQPSPYVLFAPRTISRTTRLATAKC